jgi:protein-disulfide isomerase
MAAEQSMKGFYTALAVVLLAGGVFILSKALLRKPPLTSDTVAPLATGPRGVVIGSDSAPLNVMEFSDFECPYCARFATIQMPDVQQRLIATGKVRWTFMHYPLQNHVKSPTAHLAAACANEQGRFWQMHDLIYQNQDDWVQAGNPEGRLAGYAQRAGLDRARYDQCMATRSAWGTVLADKLLGDSLGIGGTPTFYLNGRLLADVPTVDQLVRIADSVVLAKAATPATRGSRPGAR